jgi:hypothetical protein
MKPSPSNAGWNHSSPARAWNMKTLQKTLTPVGLDGNQWQKHFVDISLTSNDRLINYSGYVLTSVPRATNVIEFEFKTSSLRPAEIEIPLVLSASASVRLSIDDELIETFEFPFSPESAPIVQHITKNVTKWTEGHDTSTIRLIISYRGEQATTTVLLGGASAELGTKASQGWRWSYSLQSLAFFALAWSCIVGLAILILAHIQPLGDTFRFYAVLIAVLTWIAGVIGLPDVAKIPLRPMLRRLYSKTRSSSARPSELNTKRRVGWMLSLFLVFLLISSGVGVIIYCLSIRQYYSSLIHKALAEPDQKTRDPYIRQALSLLPWRKEAQMLFERDAYGLRDAEDMKGFRTYIREFSLDPTVKQAIIRAPDLEHLPLGLTRAAGSTFLSEPVVWYASTIIEGEDPEETRLMNEAVSILAPRTDPAARIQLGNIKLDLLLTAEPPDFDAIDCAAIELQALLTQNYTSRSTHVYQAACDTLAGYYLSLCERDLAYEWYEKELSARKGQTTDTGEPLWLRPPEKLMLYHMFATKWNMKGESVRRAVCLLEPRQCNPKLREDESCDFKSIFEEKLWSANQDYQNQVAWTRKTIRENGLRLDQIIENSLKKGWSY